MSFLSVRLARRRILAIQEVSLQAVVRSAPESSSLTITLTIKGQTMHFNRCTSFRLCTGVLYTCLIQTELD